MIPDHIEVDALYRGTDLVVQAEIPECSGVALKLQGRDEESELSRKGKVAIVWLNVAKITVRNAPQLYLIESSDELSTICPRALRDELELGYSALRKRVVIESDRELSGSEFNEFVRLKEDSGAYRISSGIRLESSGEGRQRVSSTLPIPAAVPPGEYGLSLYCFDDGRLLENRTTSVVIEEGGLPNFMRTLAYDHSAIYGVLAVTFAMAAGILIGFIFSMRRGRR